MRAVRRSDGRARFGVRGDWTLGVCAFVGLLVSSVAARAETAPKEKVEPEDEIVRRLAESSPRLAPRTCDEGWITRVVARARPSIARIERPDGGLGTGFLFHDKRHVATALHVVDLGRELVVRFPQGARFSAEVVATDPDRDLAILELSQPASFGEPLLLHGPVAVGDPVVAIGHPYGDLAEANGPLAGLLNYSASGGIVSGVSDALIQTDATLAPGNSGGPLLTCDGGVVGVADALLDAKIGFAVRVAPLVHLAGELGRRRRALFKGTWQALSPSIMFVHQSDVHDRLGFGVGTGLVAYDRLLISARFGAAFALREDSSEPVVARSVTRGFAELGVGYRFLLFPYVFPMYLSLEGGAAGLLDRGTETRLSAEVDGSCAPGAPCPPRLRSSQARIRGGGVQPYAVAELRLAPFVLGYGVLVDVINPEFSTLQLHVGLTF